MFIFPSLKLHDRDHDLRIQTRVVFRSESFAPYVLDGGVGYVPTRQETFQYLSLAGILDRYAPDYVPTRQKTFHSNISALPCPDTRVWHAGCRDP